MITPGRALGALTAVLLLSGCSVSVQNPTPPVPLPTATPSSSAPESARPTPSATDSSSTGTAPSLPGYPPGQFPTVPLFSLPDVSRLSTADTRLRDKLLPALTGGSGVKVTAVACGKDGQYLSRDSSLVLYGKGDGSYVGPDGSYTRSANGAETSVTDRQSITRDGRGGGTYVGNGLSITNDGDGSGTYVSKDVSITIDGKGGGTYVSDAASITNDGDGSGTFVSKDVSITIEADGSGTYVDDDVSISNDGKGRASITTDAFSGEVDAQPLPKVLPLGKFPPVVQLLPKANICGFVITLTDGVLFDFDKSEIRPDAASVLRNLADALKTVGNAPLQISGHTDAIGTDSYNQGLSERRAAAVERALRDQGVTASMSAKGYGESRPVAPNSIHGKDNPAGRQLNRRVEIFVRA